MLSQQPNTDITALTAKLSSLSMTLNASSLDTCPNPTEMDRNEQLSFQQQVDLIAAEMDRRATNIGYGAGIVIREQIATPIEQSNAISSFTSLFKQAYDYSASFIKEIVNWTSATSTEDPWEDVPLETIEKNVNSNKCYPEDESKWEAGFPQAVILQASYYRDFLEEIIAERSIYHYQFDVNLAKHYHVHTNKISTIAELCENLEKVAKLGPIKLLVLTGHGNPETLVLGPNSEIFTGFHYHNYIHAKQDLSCLSLLDKKATIISGSCNTGGESYLVTPNGTTPFLMNFHRLLALHAPGSTVYAADYYMTKNSLAIQFSPSFEVFAFAEAQVDKFYVGGVIKKILSPFIFFFDLPMRFLYSPMEKISPDNAEFCKDVVPYFSMKKYCDKIGITPTDSQVQACDQNPRCQESKTWLSRVDKYYEKKCKMNWNAL